MLKITNDKGRTFNVRVVKKGEAYGLNDCKVHDSDDALVEFYDATYEGEKFGPRGQFVSRYYASTFLSRDRDFGLCLDGGVDVWSIDQAALCCAYAYVEGATGA